jgi:hypothetical protein
MSWKTYNCAFNSTTKVKFQTGFVLQGKVLCQRYGQAASYESFYPYGTITAVTSTRHTASGYAWQMTPNNASVNLVLPGPLTFDSLKVPVTANVAVTITAQVLYDASYNGTMPTMTLIGGILQGSSVASDIVSTATAANSGNWATLTTGSITPTETGCLELYFSCNGTAGNVYVDDMTVSVNGPSTLTLDVPSGGLPAAYLVPAATAALPVGPQAWIIEG